jgi:protein ImuA
LLRRDGVATRVVVAPAPAPRRGQVRGAGDLLTPDLFAAPAVAAPVAAPAHPPAPPAAPVSAAPTPAAAPPAPSAAEPAVVPACWPPALEDLHPALWRAHQLGRSRQGVCPSGHEELDAQLPGGGWPQGVVTELLLPQAGVGELRLLAPALAALQQQQRGLMWLNPPARPCAWALAQLGIDVRQLVLVHARAPGPLAGAPPGGGRWAARSGGAGGAAGAGRAGLRSPLPAADILWALEHALKGGHLGAVLAWLPARLPADALRRLQLAAQSHEGPVFLLRDAVQRHQPSAAPLRLLLASAGPDQLRVHLLKRRGPPLAEPLTLALPPVLVAPVAARAQQAWAAWAAGAEAAAVSGAAAGGQGGGSGGGPGGGHSGGPGGATRRFVASAGRP